MNNVDGATLRLPKVIYIVARARIAYQSKKKMYNITLENLQKSGIQQIVA